MKKLLYIFFLGLLAVSTFSGKAGGVTRYYLPSTGAADVNPTYSSDWHNNGSAARLELVTTKISSAMTSATATTDATAGTRYHLIRQYVSNPLAAQTITGTVKGVISGLESNTAADVTLAIKIFVVSNDGATVRGTLLAISTPDDYTPGTGVGGSEFTNVSLTNRQVKDATEATSLTLTDVTTVSQDRLVIEIGTAERTTNSTRTMTVRIGDASASDLAENETGTSDDNPWVEFSANITESSESCPSGPNSAGSAVGQFANPTNVFTANNVRATTGTVGDTMAVYDFGLAPISGNNIDGIEVMAEWLATGTNGMISQLNIRLSFNGGTTWTGAKAQTRDPEFGESQSTSGGASDTWGRSWTTSELTNTNFRVGLIYAAEDEAANTIGVDYLTVKVHCSAAGGAGNIRRQRILRYWEENEKNPLGFVSTVAP